MQKLLLCLFVCVPFFIKAQMDIINTSVYEANIRYLYGGIDNLIKVNGLDDTTYTLVSSTGNSIKKAGFSNTFYLSVNQPNSIDTLKIIKNNKVIYKETFTTSKLTSEPLLRLGTIGKSTSVKELSLANELLLVFPDSLKHSFSVVSFKVVTSRNLKKDIHCMGNVFSTEAYAAIKKLKQGDNVFFDEIKARGPDGATRTLASFFLTIE